MHGGCENIFCGSSHHCVFPLIVAWCIGDVMAFLWQAIKFRIIGKLPVDIKLASLKLPLCTCQELIALTVYGVTAEFLLFKDNFVCLWIRLSSFCQTDISLDSAPFSSNASNTTLDTTKYDCCINESTIYRREYAIASLWKSYIKVADFLKKKVTSKLLSIISKKQIHNALDSMCS